MKMSAKTFLDYMGRERIPAAGGDVIVLRIAGVRSTTNNLSDMEKLVENLIPNREYTVEFDIPEEE